jgi:predicted DCC family thiol-disulfide oxidoreductase YuxK
VIKRDKKKKFKFASLQSVSGQKVLEKLNIKPDALETIIYFSNNKYYTKSTAILQILKDIGGVWQLMFVFMLVPKFIRNFIYSIIAKTRYKVFGKRNECAIPTPDLSDRFLE